MVLPAQFSQNKTAGSSSLMKQRWDGGPCALGGVTLIFSWLILVFVFLLGFFSFNSFFIPTEIKIKLLIFMKNGKNMRI